MDPSMTLVAIVVSVAAQVAPAPEPTRTKDRPANPASPRAPTATPGATGRRLRLVRATDGTPIGGAEVFDIDLDPPDSTAGNYFACIERPDEEFPRHGTRLVADGEGWVEIGPSRLHSLLARAPGWFQLTRWFDADHPRKGTIELLPDLPLLIELVDAHDAALEGIPVELHEFMMCGNDVMRNSGWRVASDRSGCISFPHYSWWIEEGNDFLTPAIPLQDPPLVNVRRTASHDLNTLENRERIVRWQIPPLSKVRVEIVDAKMLAQDALVTFELVGPHQYFGTPDRFQSNRGAAVEVPAEVSVPLRALFHWHEADSKWIRRERTAFGRAEPQAGGCAVMRLEVANEPVALRLRVVRAADAAHAVGGGSIALGRFDAIVEWTDARGIRWRDRSDGLRPDEAGALEIEWRRPRLATGERPATIHVSLQQYFRRWGWEPLDEPELASRDLPWPTGPDLDVGTLIVPSAK